MKNNSDKKTAKYLKLSREFAIKQLIEKWLFEININRELFNNIPSLDELISDSHSVINLSYKEYKSIYQKITKL